MITGTAPKVQGWTDQLVNWRPDAAEGSPVRDMQYDLRWPLILVVIIPLLPDILRYFFSKTTCAMERTDR